MHNLLTVVAITVTSTWNMVYQQHVLGMYKLRSAAESHLTQVLVITFSLIHPHVHTHTCTHTHTHTQDDGPVASMIENLLQLLERDAVDNSKSCAEYFEFFRNYASYVSTQQNHCQSKSGKWQPLGIQPRA